MMEELKACPHCGGKAVFERFNNPKNWYVVRCTVCGCQTDGFRINHDDATDAQNKSANAAVWNRRAEPENKPHGLQTTWNTPDRCSYCGEHLAKEWSYCPECGKPTDLILPDNLEKPLVIRELAADYLKICENKCGGNRSTGIQPCRYWVMPDIDSDGKPIPGYCKLETYVTRKNDEK